MRPYLEDGLLDVVEFGERGPSSFWGEFERVSLRPSARQSGVTTRSGARVRVWDVGGVWIKPMSVEALVACIPDEEFHRLSWRNDTNGRELSARFAFWRVFLADGTREPGPSDRPVWLILEWRDGEEKPRRFFVSDLPETLPKKVLVCRLKERWRTERMYEDLKGEVGFDHYEGRSWPGWHHHMSVALCAYAVLVAERCMAFPPGAADDPLARAMRRAADATRRRLDPDAAIRVREGDDHVVDASVLQRRPFRGSSALLLMRG